MIDEDPIGEITYETDLNQPKTNEEYDDDGNNEDGDQESNGSQSEYYEAMGMDNITKSMPNVP